MFTAATDSSVSSEKTVIIMPSESRCRLCPLLPTLWMRLLTCLGDINWIVRSTFPMSMPSSRVLVQMMALSFPALKLSSMLMRSSLLREPW